MAPEPSEQDGPPEEKPRLTFEIVPIRIQKPKCYGRKHDLQGSADRDRDENRLKVIGEATPVFVSSPEEYGDIAGHDRQESYGEGFKAADQHPSRESRLSESCDQTRHCVTPGATPTFPGGRR